MILLKPKYWAIVIVKNNIYQWYYLSDFWLKIKRIFKAFSKDEYMTITVTQTGECKFKILSK